MPRRRSQNGSTPPLPWMAIARLLARVLQALLGRGAAPKRTRGTRPAPPDRPGKEPASEISELFRSRTSDRMVGAEGQVVKVLRDDTDTSDGSGQHQNFLVEVDAGAITVKIAHNLKFGRVPIRTGDRIRFRGEYEYDPRGGCIHWTHHDPKNWREGGWIEHRGKRYE